MSDWDDPAVSERMVEMYQAGVPTPLIARTLNGEFGTRMTRNAVIGRARRLGIAFVKPSCPTTGVTLPQAMRGPGRKPVAVRPAPKPRPPPKAPPPKPAPPASRYANVIAMTPAVGPHHTRDPLPAYIPPVRISEGPGKRTVETIKARECKWPIGDPQEPSFSLCGARSDGGSYCTHHAAVAYQPIPTRRHRASAEPSPRRFG